MTALTSYTSCSFRSIPASYQGVVGYRACIVQNIPAILPMMSNVEKRSTFFLDHRNGLQAKRFLLRTGLRCHRHGIPNLNEQSLQVVGQPKASVKQPALQRAARQCTRELTASFKPESALSRAHFGSVFTTLAEVTISLRRISTPSLIHRTPHPSYEKLRIRGSSRAHCWQGVAWSRELDVDSEIWCFAKTRDLPVLIAMDPSMTVF